MKDWAMTLSLVLDFLKAYTATVSILGHVLGPFLEPKMTSKMTWPSWEVHKSCREGHWNGLDKEVVTKGNFIVVIAGFVNLCPNTCTDNCLFSDSIYMYCACTS